MKNLKKIATLVGETALLGVLGVVAFVFVHKPDVVVNPCFRSTHRADGTPKMPFDSAQAANWQSVKQFFLHGEVCPAYKVGNTYFTGHKK